MTTCPDTLPQWHGKSNRSERNKKRKKGKTDGPSPSVEREREREKDSERERERERERESTKISNFNLLRVLANANQKVPNLAGKWGQ